MRTSKEIKAEYQIFITSIPQLLEDLKAQLNVDQLTYDPQEIDRIQDFYKTNYESSTTLKAEVKAYFGTAWLWHFGGEWYLEDHKSADQYGKACIQKYGGANYVWASLNVEDWLDAIEVDFLEESIGASFRQMMDYFERHPEYILEPVRNMK